MKTILGATFIVGLAVLGVKTQESRTVWDGIYSEAQAKRGEAVYAETCANCHGAVLEGIDMSPALNGATFSSNWNDLTVGDLAERIRISMPADRPGTMPRAQIIDVVAFMLKANKFPAGTTDMAQDIPMLKQIRIVHQKPAPSH
jgi:S-disulfanyl-L-cysteine oxidoreductase SoxD